MPPSPLGTGSGSAMAAPVSLIDASPAHSTVRLTPTAQGMRVFLIKIPSILGPHLSQTLMAAQRKYASTNSWEPESDNQKLLFQHIFNRLIPCLDGQDALILRMNRNCDMENMLTANDALVDTEFHLNAKLLSALLIAKLPPSLLPTRAAIIQQTALPAPQDLISIMKAQIGFDAAASAATSTPSFATAFIASNANPYAKFDKRCLNCDSSEHASSKCPKPTTPCDACGLFAGHLAKYCLVKNDSPLPTSWDRHAKLP